MSETRDGALTSDRPWPGMRPYREQDAGYFYGRRAEIADLRNRTERSMLTLLYARGGLGKTSLLRAGLSPTLAERAFLPVYLRPRLLLEDGHDPVAEVMRCVAEAAAKADVEATARLTAPTLWELLHREAFDLWDASNRLVTLVLIFDQFEELFQVIDEDPAAAPRAKGLLTNIADLVENRLPARLGAIDLPDDAEHRFDTGMAACRVILSFREDYLPQVRRLRAMLPSVVENHLRLEPLSGAQALEVVEGAGGEHVDPEAARVLVRAVGRRAGLLQRLLDSDGPADSDTPGSVANLEVEPAILSVVCFHLNTERLQRNSGTIDVDLVRRKQPQDIFEDYYLQAMASTGPAARQFVETRLVTAGGERVLYPMSAVTSSGADLGKAVAALVEQGILRKEWFGGEERLEISHDLLLRPVRQAVEAAKAEAARRKRARFAGSAAAVAALLIGGAVLYQRQALERTMDQREGLNEALLVAYLSAATNAAISQQDMADLIERVNLAGSTPERMVLLEKILERSRSLGQALPPPAARRLQEVAVDYVQLKIDRDGTRSDQVASLLPKLRASVEQSCEQGFVLPGDRVAVWFDDRGGVPATCR